MKTKAFGLIEILIATIIFMTVVIVTVASFAMVKRSNEMANDSAKTDECSRQIENLAGSIFRSASEGDPLVMAVVKSGGNYLLLDLSDPDSDSETDTETDVEIDAVGYATFEKAPVMDQVQLVVIFKNTDIEKPGYYYKLGSVDKADVKGGMNLTGFLGTGIEKIHSSACAPLVADGSEVGFSGNYDNPFHLKLSYPYKGGPASQIGKPIYSLVLNDLLFSSYSDKSVEDKSISKLYVEVTNNIKSF